MPYPKKPSAEISPPRRHAPVRIRARDKKGFEKTVLFKKNIFRIGRDPGSDLHLEHPSMAACEILILREEERYLFTDTGGKTGACLNGRPAATGDLVHGDRITFGPDGPYEITFLVEGDRVDDDQERNLRALLSASRTINSSLVLDQVLEKVMDSVMEVTRAGKGFLMLVEPDGSLRARVARKIEREALDQKVIPASRSVIQQVVETRRSVFMMMEDAPSGAPRSMSIVRLKLKAIMCVPILSPERLIGVIYVDHDKRLTDVTKTDLKILEALADHATVAIENANLSERMLLAERVSTVGRMVSSIVHDIRGPLTGIRAAAELLAADAGGAKAPRLTRMIIAEVDRMSGMAQEILDFCRGQQDLHTSQTDLAVFLGETIEPLRDPLEARRVSLNLDLGAVGTVTLDTPRMGRVLRNLVDNALDAMPEGGLLTISARVEEGQAVVRVSDTGVGMTEEIRGKIFEPFFTHGKKNGNGLGMAIAARIVESHGGKVEVESAPGEGTTIRLALPLQPEPQAKDRAETVPVGAAAR